jgi:hypothetical protein
MSLKRKKISSVFVIDNSLIRDGMVGSSTFLTLIGCSRNKKDILLLSTSNEKKNKFIVVFAFL